MELLSFYRQINAPLSCPLSRAVKFFDVDHLKGPFTVFSLLVVAEAHEPIYALLKRRVGAAYGPRFKVKGWRIPSMEDPGFFIVSAFAVPSEYSKAPIKDVSRFLSALPSVRTYLDPYLGLFAMRPEDVALATLISNFVHGASLEALRSAYDLDAMGITLTGGKSVERLEGTSVPVLSRYRDFGVKYCRWPDRVAIRRPCSDGIPKELLDKTISVGA